MHSHVVEFLSAVFARFNVTFYLEYHCTAVSEVSRGKKWSVNPFQTLKVQDTEYTYSSANFRNYGKKKQNWVISQNLQTLVLRWCSEMNIGETWYFSLPGTWSKVTSLRSLRQSFLHLHFISAVHIWFISYIINTQGRIVANIFGKEVNLHWQEVCSTNSVFIIRSQ